MLTILIVENSPEDRKSITNILSRQGFSVVACALEEAEVVLGQEQAFDLAFVPSELRGHPRLAELPVVGIGEHGGGFSRYVHKPYRPDPVLEAIFEATRAMKGD